MLNNLFSFVFLSDRHFWWFPLENNTLKFFASVSYLPHVSALGCSRSVWFFGTPMDCSPPGKNTGVSVPAVLQGTFRDRNPVSWVSCFAGRCWSPREAPIYCTYTEMLRFPKKKRILSFCSSLLIIFKSHYRHHLSSSSLSSLSNLTLRTPLDAWQCDRR